MTVRDSITRTGARTPGAEDYPTSMAAHGRAPIPTQCGITAVVSTCAKGRHKPNISRCMPGAGLSRSMRGKVLPDIPPSQPYRGNPAVRNDREGRGNVGIIEARSAPRLYPTEGLGVQFPGPTRHFRQIDSLPTHRLSRSDVIGCYRHQCNEGAPAPSSVILPIRSRIKRPGGLAPPAPGPDGSEELPDPLGAGFLGAALAPFFFVVVAWPVLGCKS